MLSEELEAIVEKVDYLEASHDRLLLELASAKAENRELKRRLAEKV